MKVLMKLTSAWNTQHPKRFKGKESNRGEVENSTYVKNIQFLSNPKQVRKTGT